MVRISSTLARDTSESSSFLKVDPRKKQITLYDPLACGGQNVFQKRGSQVPPKMFAFDAVFPQDASQVRPVDQRNYLSSSMHQSQIDFCCSCITFSGLMPGLNLVCREIIKNEFDLLRFS